MTRGAVTVVDGVVDAIVRHARAESPRECCGLLVGSGGRIEESVPTTNMDPDPCRFRVDPHAHIELNRHLRGSGREVIGVYHSHPVGRPEPSPSDVAEAMYPEFLHVIVSLAGPAPDIRAFRITRDIVVNLAIEPEAERTRS